MSKKMFKTLLASLFAVALLALPTAADANAPVPTTSAVTCHWFYTTRTNGTQGTPNPTSPVLPDVAPPAGADLFCYTSYQNVNVDGTLVRRPAGQRRVGWVRTTATGAVATADVTTGNPLAWYRFTPQGVLQSGWVTVGNQHFFLDNREDTLNNEGLPALANGFGRMLDNFQEDLPFSNRNTERTENFLFRNGAMVTGWQEVNGWNHNSGRGLENGWYRFAANGAQVIGWTQSRGIWYYMNDVVVGIPAAGTTNVGRMITANNSEGRVTLPRSNRLIEDFRALNLGTLVLPVPPAQPHRVAADFVFNNAGHLLTGNFRTNTTNSADNVFFTYVTDSAGALLLGAVEPLDATGQRNHLGGTWHNVGGQYFRVQPDGRTMSGAWAWPVDRLFNADGTENRVRHFSFDTYGVMRTGNRNGWVTLTNATHGLFPGDVPLTVTGANTYLAVRANGELVQGWHNVNGRWFYIFDADHPTEIPFTMAVGNNVQTTEVGRPGFAGPQNFHNPNGHWLNSVAIPVPVNPAP